MKKELLYLVFALLPLLVLSSGYPSFMESLEQCRNESKVTQEEYFNVMRHEIPKTKAEECLSACVQKKMGFMAADNKMNIDKILQSIEHFKNIHKDRYENLKKIYEACKSAEKAEKDQCTAAKNFAECVIPKERALGPLPGPPRRHPFFNGKFEECRNKTGASISETHNVMHREIPKTKNEQCLTACIYKKMGLLGDDNKIDMDKIKHRYRVIKEHNPLMYNRTIQMYSDCKATEKSETDECVAGKKYGECIFPKERLLHLPPVMRKNVQECRSKTNATDAEIYTSVLRKEIPKSKGESCMLACMQKKSGIMNPDNTIKIERMKNAFANIKFYNEDIYQKSLQILESCKAKEVKEPDECVAAQKFAECVNPKQDELRKSMVHSVP